MTWRPVAQTAAESETTFRWDDEERVLNAGTTSYRVANRWKKAGLPVMVLSKGKDGEPRSWSLDIPWTGRRIDWLTAMRVALTQFKAPTRTTVPV